jgi:uncharacterized protein (DUF3820 family)
VNVTAPYQHRLPFGKHRGKTVADVPSDYLSWLLRNVRLSSGLRLAVTDVLRSRGVQVAPPPPVPPEPVCPDCGLDTRIFYGWLETSNGERRIQRLCGCGRALGLAPHIEPYLSLAEGSADATVLLDVLVECEALRITLRSDGKAVRVVAGWDRLTLPLRQKLSQCRHGLAQLIGDETMGAKGGGVVDEADEQW